MWDETVCDKNQLAQEDVQILLNLMVEVFGSKGIYGIPIWLWDPGIKIIQLLEGAFSKKEKKVSHPKRRK